jgi:predicted nuclease with TOPRIM domain
MIQELHDRIAELEAENDQLRWDLSMAEDTVMDLESELAEFL